MQIFTRKRLEALPVSLTYLISFNRVYRDSKKPKKKACRLGPLVPEYGPDTEFSHIHEYLTILSIDRSNDLCSILKAQAKKYLLITDVSQETDLLRNSLSP